MNVVAKIEKIAKMVALAQPGDQSSLACLVVVARHNGVHLSVPQLIHDNVLIWKTGLDRAASQMRTVGRPEGKSRASDVGWPEPVEKGDPRDRHTKERRQHGAAAGRRRA